jgi:hypothetical protein
MLKASFLLFRFFLLLLDETSNISLYSFKKTGHFSGSQELMGNFMLLHKEQPVSDGHKLSQLLSPLAEELRKMLPCHRCHSRKGWETMVARQKLQKQALQDQCYV